jgi:hypothetical protein
MLPATKDDPRQRKPDITLAGQQLDWKPVVSSSHCRSIVFQCFNASSARDRTLLLSMWGIVHFPT